MVNEKNGILGRTPKNECGHTYYLPVDNDTRKSYIPEAMARLKAFCTMMTAWKELPHELKFCCWFYQSQKNFFDLVDQYSPDYVHSTSDSFDNAYQYAYLKLQNLIRERNQIETQKKKCERGIYDE